MSKQDRERAVALINLPETGPVALQKAQALLLLDIAESLAVLAAPEGRREAERAARCKWSRP